jgi:hypothetical protein
MAESQPRVPRQRLRGLTRENGNQRIGLMGSGSHALFDFRIFVRLRLFRDRGTYRAQETNQPQDKKNYVFHWLICRALGRNSFCHTSSVIGPICLKRITPSRSIK